MGPWHHCLRSSLRGSPERGSPLAQGSPPEAADVGRVSEDSSREKTTWRPAARANEGSVAPTGSAKITITKYRAAPGIQLANADHRQGRAPSKNSSAA